MSISPIESSPYHLVSVHDVDDDKKKQDSYRKRTISSLSHVTGQKSEKIIKKYINTDKISKSGRLAILRSPSANVEHEETKRKSSYLYHTGDILLYSVDADNESSQTMGKLHLKYKYINNNVESDHYRQSYKHLVTIPSFNARTSDIIAYPDGKRHIICALSSSLNQASIYSIVFDPNLEESFNSDEVTSDSPDSSLIKVRHDIQLVSKREHITCVKCLGLSLSVSIVFFIIMKLTY